jgi:hypothetical protein
MYLLIIEMIINIVIKVYIFSYILNFIFSINRLYLIQILIFMYELLKINILTYECKIYM